MSLHLSMKKFLMVLILILAVGNSNGFSATTDHTEDSKHDVELSIDNDIVQTVGDKVTVPLAHQSLMLVEQPENKFFNYGDLDLDLKALTVEGFKNYNRIERKSYNLSTSWPFANSLFTSGYKNNTSKPPSNFS